MPSAGKSGHTAALMAAALASWHQRLVALISQVADDAREAWHFTRSRSPGWTESRGLPLAPFLPPLQSMDHSAYPHRGTQAGPLEEGAGGRQQASRSLSDCGDMTQTHDTILSRGRHESEQEGWGQAQLLLWAQAKMRMVRGRKEESSAGLGSDEPWSTPTPTP